MKKNIRRDSLKVFLWLWEANNGRDPVMASWDDDHRSHRRLRADGCYRHRRNLVDLEEMI